MSFASVAIFLLSLTGVARAEVPSELPSRAEFCTGAGPIELEFRGEQVSGKYRILVPGKDVRGKMSLRWSHGFLEGEWIDEDGRGPIVIVLHDRGERMTGGSPSATRLQPGRCSGMSSSG